MPKLLIAAVALTITRDPMTILPRDLPAHEVPIAQAVFGEDNVEIHEGRDLQPVAIDTDIEAERLAAKWGEGSLEKAYGVNFKSGIARAIKDASLGEAPAEEGGSTAGGTVVEAVDLQALTKAQLLEVAAQREVTVDPSLTKAKIIAAIEAAAE